MTRQDIEPQMAQTNAEIKPLILIGVILISFPAFNRCHLRHLWLNSGVLRSARS